MSKEKSISNLRQELAAKHKQLTRIMNQCDQLVAQLNKAVDQQTSTMPARAGTVSARPKAKPKPGLTNLGDWIADQMKGKGAVKVSVITRAVLQAGYETRSNQFANIVSQTLLADPRFVNVQRGVYRLKNSAGPGAPAKKTRKKKVAGTAAKKTTRRKKKS